MNNLEKLILAIKKINSNAEFEATDVDNIIWKNGTTPISKSDIEAKITDIKANGTVEENKKASAVTKLKALGLTDAEIEALKI